MCEIEWINVEEVMINGTKFVQSTDVAEVPNGVVMRHMHWNFGMQIIFIPDLNVSDFSGEGGGRIK